MCRAHKIAYKILINKIIEAQQNGGIININSLQESMLREAKLVEIAPGRTALDWIKDQEEAGNVVKIAPNKYKIVKDIIIVKK